MFFKNMLRIFKSYRLSILIVFFFEFFYILIGYKGNSYSFSKKKDVADNIPCPYLFLKKILIILKDLKIKNFFDLGCGSGRVINFFYKNSLCKYYFGYELFKIPFLNSSMLFKKETNIKIFNSNFKKIVIKKKNSCFFFNLPFSAETKFINYLKKNKNFLFKKGNIIILVNFNQNILRKLKFLKKINKYYIAEKKGFFVCKFL